MISQEILCQTQNSLQMIWRCIGYSGILRKMWKSYRKIFLPWNLGAMTGYRNLTLINAKWCTFLKRMIAQALNFIHVVTSWKLYLKLRISGFTLLRTCHKANSVLGFIRRTVGPKDPELFSKLYYRSLARQILEYVLLSSLVSAP